MGRRKQQREREPVPLQSIDFRTKESALVVNRPSSRKHHEQYSSSTAATTTTHTRATSSSPLKQRTGGRGATVTPSSGLGGGGDGRRGRSPLRFLRRKFTRSLSPQEKQQLKHEHRRPSALAGVDGGIENNLNNRQLVPIPKGTDEVLGQLVTFSGAVRSPADGGNSHHGHPKIGIVEVVSPLTEPTFYSRGETSDAIVTNQAVVFDSSDRRSTSRNHHGHNDSRDDSTTSSSTEKVEHAKIVIYSGGGRSVATQPRRKSASGASELYQQEEGADDDAVTPHSKQAYVTVSFPTYGDEKKDDHHHHHHQGSGSGPKRTTTLTIFPNNRDETEIVLEQHHRPRRNHHRRDSGRHHQQRYVQPPALRDTAEGGGTSAGAYGNSALDSATRRGNGTVLLPDTTTVSPRTTLHKNNSGSSSSSLGVGQSTSVVGNFLTSARARFGRRFSQKQGGGLAQSKRPSTPRSHSGRNSPQPRAYTPSSNPERQRRPTVSEYPSFDLATTCSAASTSIALLDVDESSAVVNQRGGRDYEEGDISFLDSTPHKHQETFDKEEDDEHNLDYEECKEEISEVAVNNFFEDDPSVMTENPPMPDAPIADTTRILYPSKESHPDNDDEEGNEKDFLLGVASGDQSDGGIPTLLEVDVSRKRVRNTNSGSNGNLHVLESADRAKIAETTSGSEWMKPNTDQVVTQPQKQNHQPLFQPEKVSANNSPESEAALLYQETTTTTAKAPAIATPTPNTIIFLLLLDPKSKFFELIRVMYAPATTTIGDILAMIPENATEPVLAKQRYNGLIRPRSYARCMNDKKQLASNCTSTATSEAGEMAAVPSNHSDREDHVPSAGIDTGEILIAIPYEYATKYVCRLGRQILANQRIQSLLENIDAAALSKDAIDITRSNSSGAATTESDKITTVTSITRTPPRTAAEAAENRKKRRLSPGRSTPTHIRRSQKDASRPNSVDPLIGANDEERQRQKQQQARKMETLEKNRFIELPVLSTMPNHRDNMAMLSTPKVGEAKIKSQEAPAALAAKVSSIAQEAPGTSSTRNEISVKSSTTPSSVPSMIHSHATTNAASPANDSSSNTWKTARRLSNSSSVASAGTNNLNMLRRHLQQERLQEQQQQQHGDEDDADSSLLGRFPSPRGSLIKQKIHELEERFQHSVHGDDEEEDKVGIVTDRKKDSSVRNWSWREGLDELDLVTAQPKTVKRENKSVFQNGTNKKNESGPSGRYLDFGGCRSDNSSSSRSNTKLENYFALQSPSDKSGNRMHRPGHNSRENSPFRSRRSQRSDHVPIFHQQMRNEPPHPLFGGGSNSDDNGRALDDNESQWSIDMSYTSWSRSVDSSLAHRRLIDAARNGSRSLIHGAHSNDVSSSSYNYGRRLKQRKIIRKMRRYLAAGLILLIFLYTFDSGPDSHFSWMHGSIWWHAQAPSSKTSGGPLGLFGLIQLSFALVVLIKLQLFLQQPPDAECKCPLIQGCAVYIENLRRRKRGGWR